MIAYFNDRIPSPPFDGIFDERTRNSVIAFQQSEGLSADGVVGRDTWNALLSRYDQLVASLPSLVGEENAETAYPGRFLAQGQEGEDVRRLQRLINQASERYSYIPSVTEDGIYGVATATAVRAVQENNGITPNGIVGPVTWETVVNLAGE